MYNTAGRIPPFVFHKDTLPIRKDTYPPWWQGYNTLAPAGPRKEGYPLLPAGPAQETCRLPQIKERTAVTGGQLNIGEEPSVDHQQFICSLRNHIVDQCTIEIS